MRRGPGCAEWLFLGNHTTECAWADPASRRKFHLEVGSVWIHLKGHRFSHAVRCSRCDGFSHRGHSILSDEVRIRQGLKPNSPSQVTSMAEAVPAKDHCLQGAILVNNSAQEPPSRSYYFAFVPKVSPNPVVRSTSLSFFPATGRLL